jgi:hypothetical protein
VVVHGEDGDWSGAAVMTSIAGADGSGGGGGRCKSSVVAAAGIFGRGGLSLMAAGRGRLELVVADRGWLVLAGSGCG